jgi:hypothetical protein
MACIPIAATVFRGLAAPGSQGCFRCTLRAYVSALELLPGTRYTGTLQRGKGLRFNTLTLAGPRIQIVLTDVGETFRWIFQASGCRR